MGYREQAKEKEIINIWMEKLGLSWKRWFLFLRAKWIQSYSNDKIWKPVAKLRINRLTCKIF